MKTKIHNLIQNFHNYNDEKTPIVRLLEIMALTNQRIDNLEQRLWRELTAAELHQQALDNLTANSRSELTEQRVVGEYKGRTFLRGLTRQGQPTIYYVEDEKEYGIINDDEPTTLRMLKGAIDEREQAGVNSRQILKSALDGLERGLSEGIKQSPAENLKLGTRVRFVQSSNSVVKVNDEGTISDLVPPNPDKGFPEAGYGVTLLTGNCVFAERKELVVV